jgi:MerR family mercuric resistance operon transcriptional regulator
MAFTIGRLADAAGVHLETVRYYEREGLLQPPPRTPSGYRQYADADLWRLQFIARGKHLGFTLKEIAALLDEGAASPAAVLEATRHKIDEVVARQAELEELRLRLEAMTALCERGDADCATLQL